MTDVFDEKALMDQVDGDMEFLEETVAMLDEDSPRLVEQIRAAATTGDAAALVKPAHTLKGMLSNFCAEPAEAAARELEEMGREERLNDVEAAADLLERETERLKEELHRFLSTRTK